MSGLMQGVISRVVRCLRAAPGLVAVARMGKRQRVEEEWDEVTHGLWMSWVSHGKSGHKKCRKFVSLIRILGEESYMALFNATTIQ
jgi:hypothetical protein